MLAFQVPGEVIHVADGLHTGAAYREQKDRTHGYGTIPAGRTGLPEDLSGTGIAKNEFGCGQQT